MKKFASLFILALIMLLSINAFAEEDGWKSAYTSAIKTYGNEWGNIYVLNDFDIDGTPELLLGSYPGSGLFSGVEKFFTYKNNSLIELTDNDTLIDTEYQLYQNYGSGDLRIEGGYAIRAGWMGSSVLQGEYYLDNGLQFIPKFEKSTTRENKNGNIIETYDFYVNKNKTSENNYNNEIYNYHIGWLKVNSYNSASFHKHKKLTSSEISEFINSYKEGPALAYASTDNVTLDGEDITPNIPAGYNIADRNYYKLRDIAMTLNGSSAQFEIEWKNNAIYIETGKAYTSVGGELSGTISNERNLLAEPNDAPVYIDGTAVQLKSYNINGNNYFQVRDLGAKLGFDVDYDGDTSTVLLSTSDYDNKVKAFLADERFKNGVAWGDEKTPLICPNKSKWGCAAYAADFVKFVFDKDSQSSGELFTNADEIRSGDVIHVTNTTHWFVVLYRNGNSLQVAEGNWGGMVVVSDGLYTIENGEIYREGERFRPIQDAYHYK